MLVINCASNIVQIYSLGALFTYINFAEYSKAMENTHSFVPHILSPSQCNKLSIYNIYCLVANILLVPFAGAIRRQLPVIQQHISEGIISLEKELESLGGPGAASRGSMIHLVLQLCRTFEEAFAKACFSPHTYLLTSPTAILGLYCKFSPWCLLAICGHLQIPEP